LITPDQLRRIAEEKEMAQLREALEKKRKADEAQHQMRQAFMLRDVHPEVFEGVSKVVRAAAERGEQRLMALRFPREYCTDGGRAINSFEPDTPKTLTGFAKRAYEFWLQAARPDHGFSRRHAGRAGVIRAE
jgi:hypothetical protein